MSSSVPNALPAFKALALAALPAGSQYWLGTVMPVYEGTPGSVEGLGSAITLQVSSIHFLMDDFAVLGPLYKHEEHYNVLCCLIAWAGDKDYEQRTQDVYSVYADLSIAVANNPTLELPNGVDFRLAHTRQLDFTPCPDPLGRATAQIEFEIECEARATSLS